MRAVIHMSGSPYLEDPYRKPRLSWDELEMQIALGTIPPEYIRAQVWDPEILDKLANLPDDKVQAVIAIHPNTNIKTLIKLVEDPNVRIDTLIVITANSKLPIEMLYRLLRHKDPRVSEEAKGCLHIRSKGFIDIQDD